jgi:predicted nuclease of predicted toxin-antitoxin system
MNPSIVADESVDFGIVVSLRGAGFQVVSILEEHPGWPDAQVLDLAFRSNAFLITEDKDFGELTYRLRKPSHGILLIRLIHEDSEAKAAVVLNVLLQDFSRLWNAFSVLERTNLRVKPLRF